MKIKILFLALLMGGNVLSQDPYNGKYILKINKPLTKASKEGIPVVPEEKVVISNSYYFYVINETDSNYVIYFPKFTSNSVEATKLNLELNKDKKGNEIYFLIPRSNFKEWTQKPNKKYNFVVGTATTLLKWRPGNGENDANAIYSDVGNDFDIGITAGVKIIPSIRGKFSLSVVGGFGYASIKVTSESTRGVATTDTTLGAISIKSGAIFEYDDFQIALFLGWDYASGKLGKSWIYQGRRWVGLGFGYEIFQSKKQAN